MHTLLMYYLFMLANLLGVEAGEANIERKLGIKHKYFPGVLVAFLWPIFVPCGLLFRLYVKLKKKTEEKTHVVANELPGHRWVVNAMTGNTYCAKCGVLFSAHAIPYCKDGHP